MTVSVVERPARARVEFDDAQYDAMFRALARSRDGRLGEWSYQAFDYINATYFAGMLPATLILWNITAYGGCLGFSTGFARPPFIQLHPGLLGIAAHNDGRKTKNWGLDGAWLGVSLAYDTVLHECMHIAHRCLHVDGCDCGPEWKGKTSHNNPHWIAEVNRIAPSLGLDIVAARNKSVRVPISDGPIGKRGRPKTKSAWRSDSTVSFDAVSRFPYAVRIELGATDWFERKELPFPHVLAGRSQ